MFHKIRDVMGNPEVPAIFSLKINTKNSWFELAYQIEREDSMIIPPSDGPIIIFIAWE